MRKLNGAISQASVNYEKAKRLITFNQTFADDIEYITAKTDYNNPFAPIARWISDKIK